MNTPNTQSLAAKASEIYWALLKIQINFHRNKIQYWKKYFSKKTRDKFNDLKYLLVMCQEICIEDLDAPDYKQAYSGNHQNWFTLYLVLDAFNAIREPVYKLFPVEMSLPSVNNTSKNDHAKERRAYRQLHALALANETLNKRHYSLYKAIAIKYDLPYIKEIYDDE